MNSHFFFSEPCYSDSDIHIVFTSRYDDDIVFLSEPHLFSFFR